MADGQGRALDIEVLTKVFGVKVKRVYCRYGKPWDEATAEHPSDRPFYIPSGKPWRTHYIDAVPVPRYSSDMNAATLVLDRMGELGWHARLSSPFHPGQPWFCGFTPHFTTGWNGRPDHEAEAERPAEAIARAALLAVAEREGVR